jgi:hypothetical protein
MHKLYRFSPIKTEEDFDKVLEYLVNELENLSLKYFEEKLPINTLKVFAHYPEEYDFLYKLVYKLGPKAVLSSETSYYVNVNKKIKDYKIDYIGLRIVDPYRMQVGCGDYEIKNFNEIKEKFKNTSQYIREFSDDMIEIWDPDSDVLGYVVPPL